MVADAASAPATGRIHRAKRVARACDYCRKKRLKCAPNQRPCLNCQLYNQDCTSHDRGRRASVQAVERTPEPAAENAIPAHNSVSSPTEDPSIDVNPDSAIDAHCNGSDNNLLEPQWTQAQTFSDEGNNQDFGNVLRQLGISVSPNFWDIEKAMLNNLPDIDTGFLGLGVNNSEAAMGHLTAQGAYQNKTSPAAYSSQSHRSTADSANGKVSSIESLTRRDGNSTESQRSAPPGVFIRKNDVVANYIGLSSVGATLALCVKDALESQRRPASPSSLGFLIEAGSHVDEVGLSSLFDHCLQQLPPRDAAMAAIDAYFSDLNVFYPILDEGEFRIQVEMLYLPDRSQLKALDYSLFFLAVSIGALSQNHGSNHHSSNERLSIDVYEQAWSMIQDAIASPSETSLQVLLLHLVRHLYFGRCGIAWVFCGLAVRIAESLGLHRRSPRELDLSECRLRLRSRLWWILFNFNASLSLSQGRPPGLVDATYDNEIFLAEAPIEIEFNSFPSLTQIYTWTFQFSQIQNHFCNLMHSNDTVISRLEALINVDESLMAWKDSLPTSCRPDHLILVSPDRYWHVLSMHLEYLNLVRALHWATVTLKPMYSGNTRIERLTYRVRSSETLCVEAARSFIKVLNDSMGDLERKRIFVMTFQTSNYMAAIATLYRSICKNPSNLAARADLEHLRAGKIHLERDTPNNVSGPALKSLFENMLSSAQDLVWKHNAPMAKNA